MATPIIVRPQEQSPIIISGGNSSTPLNVTSKEPSNVTVKSGVGKTPIIIEDSGIDYKRIEKLVDSKVSGKADKSDTYTKSEVDALVAEGGGGSGDNNGIVIPADTYTMDIGGETYYALNSFSVKEADIKFDITDNINGFAFKIECDSIDFTFLDGHQDERKIHIEKDLITGDYLASNIFNRRIIKSSKRNFHTLYIKNERLIFDGDNLGDICWMSDQYYNIKTYSGFIKILSACSKPQRLFLKIDDSNTYTVVCYSEDEELFTQICSIHIDSFVDFEFSSESEFRPLLLNKHRWLHENKDVLEVDYAYWQKPIAKIGAKVLVTSEYFIPLWNSCKRVGYDDSQEYMRAKFSHKYFYVKVGEFRFNKDTGERFNEITYDSRFPVRAIKMYAEQNGGMSGIDEVYVYQKECLLDFHNTMIVFPEGENDSHGLEMFGTEQYEGLIEEYTTLEEILKVETEYPKCILYYLNGYGWTTLRYTNDTIRLKYHKWIVNFSSNYNSDKDYSDNVVMYRDSYRKLEELKYLHGYIETGIINNVVESHDFILHNGGIEPTTLQLLEIRKKVKRHTPNALNSDLKWIDLRHERPVDQNFSIDSIFYNIIYALLYRDQQPKFERSIRKIVPLSHRLISSDKNPRIFLQIKLGKLNNRGCATSNIIRGKLVFCIYSVEVGIKCSVLIDGSEQPKKE